jgi:hypothetical protein
LVTFCKVFFGKISFAKEDTHYCVEPKATKGLYESTPVMQNVANRENNNQISCDSPSISAPDCQTLTAQIQNVRKDMHVCRFKREISSGDINIF